MKKIYFLFVAALIYIPSSAQSDEQSKDGRFNDSLLNLLVGKWNVTSIAHENSFTAILEAEWVMNHQYMHVHFKTNEVIPWLHVPFEGEFFFGYNQTNKRYTVHEMTVHGDDGPYEGFCYAYQAGYEFKLMKKWAGTGEGFGKRTGAEDTLTVQRFTWEPLSMSWDIDMRLLVDGKEGESLVDMKLTAAKPTSKKTGTFKQ